MNKDPHIANIFSAEEEDCLSLEQMAAYQEGRLQGQEKHLVERHLLNCELCAMTFESVVENGTTVIAAGAEEVADQAWDRIQHQDKKKRRGAIFWIAAAASVALLITVGYFGFSGPSGDQLSTAGSVGIAETDPLPIDSEAKRAIAMAEEPKNEAAGVEMESMGEARNAVKEEPLELQRMGAIPKTAAPTLADGPLDNMNSAGEKDALKSAEYSSKESMKGGNSGMGKPVPTQAAPTAGVTAADPTESKSKSMEDYEKADQSYKNVFAEKASSPDPVKRTPEKKGKVADKEEMATSGDDFAGVEETEGATDGDYFDDAPTGRSMELDNVEIADERNRDRRESKIASAPAMARSNEAGVAKAPTRIADAQPANHYAEGIAAYEQGNYRDAATSLRKATEATPGNLQAHLFAADAYLRISQPKAALFHIERILATPGNSAYEDAEWYKALAYLQLKEGRKAEKQLQVVVDRNGKHRLRAEEALNALK